MFSQAIILAAIFGFSSVNLWWSKDLY